MRKNKIILLTNKNFTILISWEKYLCFIKSFRKNPGKKILQIECGKYELQNKPSLLALFVCNVGTWTIQY